MTGILPTAWGDVSSPATGRGVVVSDLLDVNARRRFAAFGRTFVDRERRRQAHKAIRAEAKAKVDVERQPGGLEPEENCSCDCCSETPIFVRFYKVITFMFLLKTSSISCELCPLTSHFKRSALGMRN